MLLLLDIHGVAVALKETNVAFTEYVSVRVHLLSTPYLLRTE